METLTRPLDYPKAGSLAELRMEGTLCEMGHLEEPEEKSTGIFEFHRVLHEPLHREASPQSFECQSMERDRVLCG